MTTPESKPVRRSMLPEIAQDSSTIVQALAFTVIRMRSRNGNILDLRVLELDLFPSGPSSQYLFCNN